MRVCVCVQTSGLTWPAASRRRRTAPAVPWAPPTRPCKAPTQWSLGQSDRWRCGGWCCGGAASGWGAAAAGRSAPYLQTAGKSRIRGERSGAEPGAGGGGRRDGGLLSPLCSFSGQRGTKGWQMHCPTFWLSLLELWPWCIGGREETRDFVVAPNINFTNNDKSLFVSSLVKSNFICITNLIQQNATQVAWQRRKKKN